MKNPFISEKYLNTKVEITPEQLGNAITEAAKKEVMYAPAPIRDRLTNLLLSFGASIMAELLVNQLDMPPITKEEEEENEAD